MAHRWHPRERNFLEASAFLVRSADEAIGRQTSAAPTGPAARTALEVLVLKDSAAHQVGEANEADHRRMESPAGSDAAARRPAMAGSGGCSARLDAAPSSSPFNITTPSSPWSGCRR